ncbi:MAG: agmatine deiminase [Gammaproteobacteria bacterium]|jgi:agmatine deiminase
MPPEWAPHAATWISWPHNAQTWPNRLARAERAMAIAVSALSAGEHVHVNVLDAAHERHVRECLRLCDAHLDVVHVHHLPTNDAWCRDHGAIFVTRDTSNSPLAAINFGFNAWGGKYPHWDLDNAIPRAMARILDVPCFDAGLILEGGSIDVNGDGALLTTEQCLLNPNRNPGMNRDDIEQALRDFLGVTQIIWLAKGIEGDDTDGHIDDITRFVSRNCVLTSTAPTDDPNHAALAANLARLRNTRLIDGTPLELLELPTPSLHDKNGHPLPASYANFYIGNDVVLMPAYGGETDEIAAGIIAGCFPKRKLRAIDCSDLVYGLGALHCLTQQLPD